MIRKVLCGLMLLMSLGATAQKSPPAIQIGYFGPFGVQFGGSGAVSFAVKQWQKEGQETKLRQLTVGPAIAYFAFPNVQQNLQIQGEANYHWMRTDKRFHPFVGFGLGYQLGRQREGGTVSLATGEITYQTTSLHAIVPAINLGFHLASKNSIGYYLKTFAGRKMTFERENAAWFGFETGIQIKISQKQ